MGGAFKTEELGLIGETLQGLRARLRGDLDQMTDEAWAGQRRRDGQPVQCSSAYGRPGNGQLRPGIHAGPDRERARVRSS